MSAPFWEFRDFGLAHRTAEGEAVLLQHVDLSVPAGGFYLFVGESGGGKSSLLRLAAGLLDAREVPPATSGAFDCFGASLLAGFPPSLRHRVAALLQDEGLLDELSPRLNVALALRAAGRSRRLALALLAQVGLDPAPARVAQLSGGMRKRLAVARALAGEPDVLLCDEPTAGLDAEAARQIARLLRTSHGDGGRTTVVITHDVHAFDGLCDGVLVLDRQERSLRLLPAGAPLPPRVAQASVQSQGNGNGDVAHGLRRRLLALASVGETAVEAVLRLPPVETGETMRTVVRFALEPALFVAAAGAVIGGLSTFFGLQNNPVQGAFVGAVLTGTGKVLTAVLVPLLSGFFFTARIAAGAAARLGTMKQNHQVSALLMMGIRPADYLLTPLVWGMTLALPVVTAAGIVAAAFASMLAAAAVAGISTAGWAAYFFFAVDALDLRTVLVKSTLSGFLVAVVTYHLATGPKRSGAEVGDAVNAAIVAGMALVLVVHAGLTFAVYA
jgi:ABC-type transporter Mla maintaining outer membrane lipid asymmetry ATPase subunit MlaF/ABC-type transporter Mla maintaining outer membrane lipid asymmetry permease subunit MlaE